MYSEPLQTAYSSTINETIPQSSLGYHSNNKYDQFPPLMSDGRVVTASWQPEAVLNNMIIRDNHIKSNWEYRKYLTDNATKIMAFNYKEFSNDVGYVTRHSDLIYTDKSISNHDTSSSGNHPYLYSSYTEPSRTVNSDLKSIYLSREELNARKICPVITQEQMKLHK
jgi:hypothetical protein